MGIGVSVFLIAIGAIFAFAVSYDFGSIDITTVGIILMAVGALGLLVSLTVFAPWRRTTVVEDHVYEREHVHEPHDHVRH